MPHRHGADRLLSFLKARVTGPMDRTMIWTRAEGQRDGDAGGHSRWAYLLMCLPVMILAGGLGGVLVGGTVLYAGARWCQNADGHAARYALPALIAVVGLVMFLVLAGAAETLVAGR